jgi:uncharacterized coiled-coil DUF342 family protein
MNWGCNYLSQKNKAMNISDQQLDKYIQKVIETTSKIDDLDSDFRRMTHSSETLSRMNARVDTVQFSIMEIEKAVQATGTRIAEIRKDIGEINTVNAAMQAGMKELPAKMSIPPAVIDGLKNEIEALKQRLAIPLEQQVEHHHHFDAYWIITVIFMLCTCGFIYMLFKR